MRKAAETAPGSASDGELLARYRAGAAEALAEIYRRHREAVFVYVRALVTSPAAAEDLVQDLFCDLAERPEAAGRPDSLRAWLLVAGRNRALNWRSRRRVEEAAVAAAERGWFAAAESGAGGSEAGDPAALAAARELAERAAAALQELPEAQREAVLLRIWGGLTFKEAGAVAGAPLDTMVSRYAAGLAGLKARLGAVVSPLAARAARGD
ncbi:MAG: sigma-70 family RNA polymerase sigma factor [Planctomycetes bacterium]|nr:sigma-70 family RNA polymerase sigma factor [Planctomycetota bacterium]